MLPLCILFLLSLSLCVYTLCPCSMLIPNCTKCIMLVLNIHTHSLFSLARVSSFSFFFVRLLCLSIHLCISLLSTLCFFFRWPTPKRAHTLKTTAKKMWNSFHTQSKRTEHENYYGKINRFLIREKYNFNVGVIAKKKNARAQTHLHQIHRHEFRWKLIFAKNDEMWKTSVNFICECI